MTTKLQDMLPSETNRVILKERFSAKVRVVTDSVKLEVLNISRKTLNTIKKITSLVNIKEIIELVKKRKEFFLKGIFITNDESNQLKDIINNPDNNTNLSFLSNMGSSQLNT